MDHCSADGAAKNRDSPLSIKTNAGAPFVFCVDDRKGGEKEAEKQVSFLAQPFRGMLNSTILYLVRNVSMSHPKHPVHFYSPEKDDDVYAVAQPIEPRKSPDFEERSILGARRPLVSAAPELPPPPRWPMLSGVLTFPFYLNTLCPWFFTSLGLMIAAWILMFWLGPGLILGLTGARLFGMATCATAMITIGYAASCCLVIIEATSNGYDSIEISPGLEWKEWIWNYAHIAVLALEATLVGLALRLVCLSDSWQITAVGAFIAFPLVLLGALAADGAWAPVAIGQVLRSIIRLPGTWVLFYAETTGLALAWISITVAGLISPEPWPTPIYSAPFLAAYILIYARLIGRLAGCIAADSLRHQTQGDDDEDR
jgi:hypothetical protein